MSKIKPQKPQKPASNNSPSGAVTDTRSTRAVLTNHNESRQTRGFGVKNHNESRQTRRMTYNHNESRQTRSRSIGINHNATLVTH